MKICIDWVGFAIIGFLLGLAVLSAIGLNTLLEKVL